VIVLIPRTLKGLRTLDVQQINSVCLTVKKINRRRTVPHLDDGKTMLAEHL
jgi:hypothetical protein